MKSNNYIKQDVLDLGIDKIVERYDYEYRTCINKGQSPNIDTTRMYNFVVNTYGDDYIKTARNIISSKYARNRRIRQKIKLYLSLGTCIWVTLTFRDDVLESTDENTRRKYVSRYLKSKSNHYIANIDYGDKKGREHYHALVLIDWIENEWEYGWTSYEMVIICDESRKNLAKYVAKLTNHAVKVSTLNKCRLIYSRDIDNKLCKELFI